MLITLRVFVAEQGRKQEFDKDLMGNDNNTSDADCGYPAVRNQSKQDCTPSTGDESYYKQYNALSRCSSEY